MRCEGSVEKWRIMCEDGVVRERDVGVNVEETRYSLRLFREITNVQVILPNWETNKQLMNGITSEGE